jgi:hypothetical protein
MRKVGDVLYLLDRILHLYRDAGMNPARETAARSFIEWIIRRQGDGAWCGIQPPWVCSLLALYSEWRMGGIASVLRRGLDFLVQTQENRTWEEPFYTGTGFPGYGSGQRMQNGDRSGSQGLELQRGFMIKYALHRHHFPLMALGRARGHFLGAGSLPQ